MHTRKLLLISAAVVAVVLAIPGSASAASNCFPKHSHTIVKHVGNARVYDRLEGNPPIRQIYVCSLKYKKRIKLHTGDYPDSETFGNYVAAGRYIAYIHGLSCGACGGPIGSFVQVVDLKYGNSSWLAAEKYVSSDTLADCPPNFVDMCVGFTKNLVLSKSGAFAWSYNITQRDGYGQIIPGGVSINVIEKHNFGPKLKTEDITVLDRVTTGDLTSLKLSGNTLTWTNAGVPKTAPLNN